MFSGSKIVECFSNPFIYISYSQFCSRDFSLVRIHYEREREKSSYFSHKICNLKIKL